ARNFLRVLPLGRRLRGCMFLVQRRNSRFPVLQDVEVFGLSGDGGRYRPQTDRVEKYSVVHVRDATWLALRDPGSLGPALALARKILSPKCCGCGRPVRRRLCECG